MRVHILKWSSFKPHMAFFFKSGLRIKFLIFTISKGEQPTCNHKYYELLSCSQVTWLQTGLYQAWDDFDRDMMLIRENCIAYNQEGTVVRRDCDELFAFYAQEYEKVLQKWQMVSGGADKEHSHRNTLIRFGLSAPPPVCTVTSEAKLGHI